MPTYEAECPCCEHRLTYFKPLSQSDETPDCPECAEKGIIAKTEKRIFTAPLGYVDNPAFMTAYKKLY